MKTTLAALALGIAIGMAGCQTPDRTPDKQETVVAGRILTNTICTPAWFAFGVVTEPVAIAIVLSNIGYVNEDGEFDKHEQRTVMAYLFWPFTLTGMLWETTYY